jgi:hypothetical protein
MNTHKVCFPHRYNMCYKSVEPKKGYNLFICHS